MKMLSIILALTFASFVNAPCYGCQGSVEAASDSSRDTDSRSLELTLKLALRAPTKERRLLAVIVGEATNTGEKTVELNSFPSQDIKLLAKQRWPMRLTSRDKVPASSVSIDPGQNKQLFAIPVNQVLGQYPDKPTGHKLGWTWPAKPAPPQSPVILSAFPPIDGNEIEVAENVTLWFQVGKTKSNELAIDVLANRTTQDEDSKTFSELRLKNNETSEVVFREIDQKLWFSSIVNSVTVTVPVPSKLVPSVHKIENQIIQSRSLNKLSANDDSSEPSVWAAVKKGEPDMRIALPDSLEEFLDECLETAENLTDGDEIRFKIRVERFGGIPRARPLNEELKLKRKAKDSGDFFSTYAHDAALRRNPTAKGPYQLELILFASNGRVEKFKFVPKPAAIDATYPFLPSKFYRDGRPPLPPQKRLNEFTIVRPMWHSEYSYEKSKGLADGYYNRRIVTTLKLETDLSKSE